MSWFAALLVGVTVMMTFYTHNVQVYYESRKRLDGLFVKLMEIHAKYGTPDGVAEQWVEWAVRADHEMAKWTSANFLWHFIFAPSVDWDAALAISQISREQTCTAANLAAVQTDRCRADQE